MVVLVLVKVGGSHVTLILVGDNALALTLVGGSHIDAALTVIGELPAHTHKVNKSEAVATFNPYQVFESL